MTDNKRLETTLTIEIMDAMMLVDALVIAGNKAMMSGRDGARERLDRYKSVLEELIPESARHFDGEIWAEIGTALQHAQSFHVDLDPPRWRNNLWSGGYITVEVTPAAGAPDLKRVKWQSRQSDHEQGTDAVQAVHDLLTQLAPMDCTGTCDDHPRQTYRL